MRAKSESFDRLWFVGFAGHRAVPDRQGAKSAISRELEILRDTVSGELVGISSAAAGADLLFLEACREAGLKTVILLPFSENRFAEDFDDPHEWERARQAIADAWWHEVAPGGEDAPAAYHVVARQCLEIADRMLFLWDGKPARGLGGTAESVDEAARMGMPARIIDAADFSARWNGRIPSEPEHDPEFDDLPPAACVGELFEKLDQRAVAGAPRSRWFAAGSMSLNHFATILQAILVAFALAADEVGAMLKLVIVTIAASLPWIGGRLRWQQRWVRDRVKAELLRSLLACHEPNSPLRPSALELFATEEAFLRTSALRLIHMRKGWKQARDEYLGSRLENQIRYLKSKGELAARRMRIFGNLFRISSWCAVGLGAFLVISAFLNLPIAPRVQTGLSFTAAVMPGIAAWCLAMISVFEFKRRASLYRQLVEELERLRPKIAGACCASEVSRAMSQIERLLLNEVWEWQGSRGK